MKQRRVLLALGALGILGLIDSVVIGLAVGPASAQAHWPGVLEYVHRYLWQSIAVLTVVGAAITVLTVILSRDRPEAVDLLDMADNLAKAVSSNWWYETQRWHILDPYPLPVRWVPADPRLLVSWATVGRLGEGLPTSERSGAATWASAPGELAAGDDDLVEVLDRIPTRRLVVLGSRGAGKTILLIRTVLRLLAVRENGEAVPFLLPMASWDPNEQDLMTWMAQWMATTWSPLAHPAQAGSPRSIARALLEAGLIIPVLDGLDELSEDLRSSAVTRLNDVMGHCRGLILSCRTDAYLPAVNPAPDLEAPLAGAAGIELCPLKAQEVAAYLESSAGGPVGAARWVPVVAALSSNQSPPPPIAQVLTTPLMAALARAIYNPPAKEVLLSGRPDPAELLNQRTFPSKEAIEQHLYDRFIPACYLPHPNPEHPSRAFHWTADQAVRWFTYIAYYLEQPSHRTTDFMWWRLNEMLPSRRTTLVLCAVLGIVAGIGFPFAGFGIGLIVGIPAGLIGRRWLADERDGIARGLGGSLLGGQLGVLFCAATVGLGPKHEFLTRFIASGLGVGIGVAPVGRLRPGILAGFAATIVDIWYQYAETARPLRMAVGPMSHTFNAVGAALAVFLCAELLGRKDPARGLRWSWLWFVCCATVNVVVFVIISIEHGIIQGLVTGLLLMVAGGLTGLVGEPIVANLEQAGDPVSVMRHDRSSFFASWLGLGAALGIGAGLQWANDAAIAGAPNILITSVVIGLTYFVVPGMAFAFIQATWGRYAIARILLAMSGRLPWRLTAFLQDAALNRGALRQFGAVYQFRHVEIQRRLAMSLTPGHRVGFQNSATGLDLGFYAARSYSLMRPPTRGRRLMRFW